MKALSIRQPWAWAILHAGKDVENRDWATKFRGNCLIHASKGITDFEYEGFIYAIQTISLMRPFPNQLTIPAKQDLQRGGIVGIADIVDCVTESTSPWFLGAYGFTLANVKPLPFMPYKGQLGFFDIPDSVLTPEGER